VDASTLNYQWERALKTKAMYLIAKKKCGTCGKEWKLRHDCHGRSHRRANLSVLEPHSQVGTKCIYRQRAIRVNSIPNDHGVQLRTVQPTVIQQTQSENQANQGDFSVYASPTTSIIEVLTPRPGEAPVPNRLNTQTDLSKRMAIQNLLNPATPPDSAGQYAYTPSTPFGQERHGAMFSDGDSSWGRLQSDSVCPLHHPTGKPTLEIDDESTQGDDNISTDAAADLLGKVACQTVDTDPEPLNTSESGIDQVSTLPTAQGNKSRPGINASRFGHDATTIDLRPVVYMTETMNSAQMLMDIMDGDKSFGMSPEFLNYDRAMLPDLSPKLAAQVTNTSLDIEKYPKRLLSFDDPRCKAYEIMHKSPEIEALWDLAITELVSFLLI
jgi:hypothetical protein